MSSNQEFEMAVNGLVRLLDVMSYRVCNVQEDVAKLDEQGETEQKTENRLCEEELVDDTYLSL